MLRFFDYKLNIDMDINQLCGDTDKEFLCTATVSSFSFDFYDVVLGQVYQISKVLPSNGHTYFQPVIITSPVFKKIST